MPVTPALALDRSPKDKAVGQLVRQVLEPKGALRVAAAYVTKGALRQLGLPRQRLGDLALLCDPFSGNCDLDVLTTLTRGGADVRCYEDLHAKVYIGPTVAVVGSANLSAGALGARGTVEAVATCRGRQEIAALRAWFDDLHRGALRWADVLANPAQLKVFQQRRARKIGPFRPPSLVDGDYALPSLLEVLRDPTLRREHTLVFSVCREVRNVPSKREVQRAVEKQNLRLPKEWSFDYLDEPEAADIAEAEQRTRTGRGVALLTLWVSHAGERIASIRSIDEAVTTLVGSAPDGERLYYFYEPLDADVLPFDCGERSRRDAAKALNAGLQRHPAVVEQLGLIRFADPDVLAQLLA